MRLIHSYDSSKKAAARLKKIEDATITNERMIQELQFMISENKKMITDMSGSKFSINHMSNHDLL